MVAAHGEGKLAAEQMAEAAERRAGSLEHELRQAQASLCSTQEAAERTARDVQEQLGAASVHAERLQRLLLAAEAAKEGLEGVVAEREAQLQQLGSQVSELSTKCAAALTQEAALEEQVGF